MGRNKKDRKFTRFERVIAAGVAVCMLLTPSSGYAATTAPVSVSVGGASVRSAVKEPAFVPQKAPFSVPEHLGIIDDFFVGESGKTIVYLQDAHGQLSAQRSIYDLLDHLYREADIRTLFVEGGLPGQVSPDLLRFFEDDSVNEKIAEELLKDGKIGGPEIFLLKNRSEVRTYGIESQKLYFDNLISFRRVYAHKDTSDLFLEKLKMRIEAVASTQLNERLRAFVKEWLIYLDSYADVLARIEVLQKYTKEYLRLDLSDSRHQLRYPQLVRYFKLAITERKLDDLGFKGEAEMEANKLRAWLASARISRTNREAMMAVLDELFGSRADRMPKDLRGFLEVFYEEAATRKFDWEPYNYLGFVFAKWIMTQELDGQALYEEIRVASDAVTNALIESSEERELIGLYRDHYVLTKLLHLELRRDDYGLVRERADSFKPSVFSARVETVPHEGIDKVFEEALRFYELAEKREEIMMGHMMRQLETSGVERAVLITGGFHTDGLLARMKEEGLSFVSIIPRMNYIEPHDNYVNQVMLKEKLGPRDDAVTNSNPGRQPAPGMHWRDGDFHQRGFRDVIARVVRDAAGLLIGPGQALQGLNEEEAAESDERSELRSSPFELKLKGYDLGKFMKVIERLRETGENYEGYGSNAFDALAKKAFSGTPFDDVVSKRTATISMQANQDVALHGQVKNSLDWTTYGDEARGISPGEQSGFLSLGSLQFLIELKRPEDYAVLDTRKIGTPAGEPGIRFIFWKQGGSYVVRYQLIPAEKFGFDHGQRLTVVAPQDVNRRAADISARLRVNTLGPVTVDTKVNGARTVTEVNHPENYVYFGKEGGNTVYATNGVTIKLRPDRYVVQDEGYGMTLTEALEEFLLQSGKLKEERARARKTTPARVEETKLYASREIGRTTRTEGFVGGHLIEESQHGETERLNLAEELILDFPTGRDIPNSADKFRIDEAVVQGIRSVIDRLAPKLPADFTEELSKIEDPAAKREFVRQRVAILNSLAVYIRHKQKEQPGLDLIGYLRERTKGLLRALLREGQVEGMVLVPNTLSSEGMPDHGWSVFDSEAFLPIDEDIYDFEFNAVRPRLRRLEGAELAAFAGDNSALKKVPVYVTGTEGNAWGFPGQLGVAATWITLDGKPIVLVDGEVYKRQTGNRTWFKEPLAGLNAELSKRFSNADLTERKPKPVRVSFAAWFLRWFLNITGLGRIRPAVIRTVGIVSLLVAMVLPTFLNRGTTAPVREPAPIVVVEPEVRSPEVVAKSEAESDFVRKFAERDVKIVEKAIADRLGLSEAGVHQQMKLYGERLGLDQTDRIRLAEELGRYLVLTFEDLDKAEQELAGPQVVTIPSRSETAPSVELPENTGPQASNPRPVVSSHLPLRSLGATLETGEPLSTDYVTLDRNVNGAGVNDLLGSASIVNYGSVKNAIAGEPLIVAFDQRGPDNQWTRSRIETRGSEDTTARRGSGRHGRSHRAPLTQQRTEVTIPYVVSGTENFPLPTYHSGEIESVEAYVEDPATGELRPMDEAFWERAGDNIAFYLTPHAHSYTVTVTVVTRIAYYDDVDIKQYGTTPLFPQNEIDAVAVYFPSLAQDIDQASTDAEKLEVVLRFLAENAVFDESATENQGAVNFKGYRDQTYDSIADAARAAQIRHGRLAGTGAGKIVLSSGTANDVAAALFGYAGFKPALEYGVVPGDSGELHVYLQPVRRLAIEGDWRGDGKPYSRQIDVRDYVNEQRSEVEDLLVGQVKRERARADRKAAKQAADQKEQAEWVRQLEEDRAESRSGAEQAEESEPEATQQQVVDAPTVAAPERQEPVRQAPPQGTQNITVPSEQRTTPSVTDGRGVAETESGGASGAEQRHRPVRTGHASPFGGIQQAERSGPQGTRPVDFVRQLFGADVDEEQQEKAPSRYGRVHNGVGGENYVHNWMPTLTANSTWERQEGVTKSVRAGASRLNSEPIQAEFFGKVRDGQTFPLYNPHSGIITGVRVFESDSTGQERGTELVEGQDWARNGDEITLSHKGHIRIETESNFYDPTDIVIDLAENDPENIRVQNAAVDKYFPDLARQLRGATDQRALEITLQWLADHAAYDLTATPRQGAFSLDGYMPVAKAIAAAIERNKAYTGAEEGDALFICNSSCAAAGVFLQRAGIPIAYQAVVSPDAEGHFDANKDGHAKLAAFGDWDGTGNKYWKSIETTAPLRVQTSPLDTGDVVAAYFFTGLFGIIGLIAFIVSLFKFRAGRKEYNEADNKKRRGTTQSPHAPPLEQALPTLHVSADKNEHDRSKGIFGLYGSISNHPKGERVIRGYYASLNQIGVWQKVPSTALVFPRVGPPAENRHQFVIEGIPATRGIELYTYARGEIGGKKKKADGKEGYYPDQVEIFKQITTDSGDHKGEWVAWVGVQNGKVTLPAELVGQTVFIRYEVWRYSEDQVELNLPTLGIPANEAEAMKDYFGQRLGLDAYRDATPAEKLRFINEFTSRYVIIDNASENRRDLLKFSADQVSWARKIEYIISRHGHVRADESGVALIRALLAGYLGLHVALVASTETGEKGELNAYNQVHHEALIGVPYGSQDQTLVDEANDFATEDNGVIRYGSQTAPGGNSRVQWFLFEGDKNLKENLNGRIRYALHLAWEALAFYGSIFVGLYEFVTGIASAIWSWMVRVAGWFSRAKLNRDDAAARRLLENGPGHSSPLRKSLPKTITSGPRDAAEISSTYPAYGSVADLPKTESLIRAVYSNLDEDGNWHWQGVPPKSRLSEEIKRSSSKPVNVVFRDYILTPRIALYHIPRGTIADDDAHGGVSVTLIKTDKDGYAVQRDGNEIRVPIESKVENSHVVVGKGINKGDLVEISYHLWNYAPSDVGVHIAGSPLPENERAGLAQFFGSELDAYRDASPAEKLRVLDDFTRRHIILEVNAADGKDDLARREGHASWAQAAGDIAGRGRLIRATPRAAALLRGIVAGYLGFQFAIVEIVPDENGWLNAERSTYFEALIGVPDSGDVAEAAAVDAWLSGNKGQVDVYGRDSDAKGENPSTWFRFSWEANLAENPYTRPRFIANRIGIVFGVLVVAPIRFVLFTLIGGLIMFVVRAFLHVGQGIAAFFGYRRNLKRIKKLLDSLGAPKKSKSRKIINGLAWNLYKGNLKAIRANGAAVDFYYLNHVLNYDNQSLLRHLYQYHQSQGDDAELAVLGALFRMWRPAAGNEAANGVGEFRYKVDENTLPQMNAAGLKDAASVRIGAKVEGSVAEKFAEAGKSASYEIAKPTDEKRDKHIVEAPTTFSPLYLYLGPQASLSPATRKAGEEVLELAQDLKLLAQLTPVFTLANAVLTRSGPYLAFFHDKGTRPFENADDFLERLFGLVADDLRRNGNLNTTNELYAYLVESPEGYGSRLLELWRFNDPKQPNVDSIFPFPGRTWAEYLAGKEVLKEEAEHNLAQDDDLVLEGDLAEGDVSTWLGRNDFELAWLVDAAENLRERNVYVNGRPDIQSGMIRSFKRSLAPYVLGRVALRDEQGAIAFGYDLNDAKVRAGVSAAFEAWVNRDDLGLDVLVNILGEQDRTGTFNAPRVAAAFLNAFRNETEPATVLANFATGAVALSDKQGAIDLGINFSDGRLRDDVQGWVDRVPDLSGEEDYGLSELVDILQTRSGLEKFPRQRVTIALWNAWKSSSHPAYRDEVITTIERQRQPGMVMLREIIQNARDITRNPDVDPEVEFKRFGGKRQVRVRSFLHRRTSDGKLLHKTTTEDAHGMEPEILIKKFIPPQATTKSPLEFIQTLVDRGGPAEDIARKIIKALVGKLEEDRLNEVTAEIVRMLEDPSTPASQIHDWLESQGLMDETKSSGFFGVGNYTIYEDTDEVTVRTGINGKVYELHILAERDPVGRVVPRVLSFKVYEDPKNKYKGTLIERIKYVENTPEGRRRADLEDRSIRYNLMKYVGAVSPEEVEIIFVDADGAPLNVAIHDPQVDLASYGALNVRQGEYGISRVTINRLYIQDPGKRELFAYVPETVFVEWVRANGINYDFVAGTEPTEARTALLYPEEHRVEVAVGTLSAAADAYRRGDFNAPGLLPTYERLLGSPRFFQSSAELPLNDPQVLSDADHINSGRAEAIAAERWEAYGSDAKLFAALMLHVKTPDENGNRRSIFDEKVELFFGNTPAWVKQTFDADPRLREAVYAENFAAKDRSSFARIAAYNVYHAVATLYARGDLEIGGKKALPSLELTAQQYVEANLGKDVFADEVESDLLMLTGERANPSAVDFSKYGQSGNEALAEELIIGIPVRDGKSLRDFKRELKDSDRGAEAADVARQLAKVTQVNGGKFAVLAAFDDFLTGLVGALESRLSAGERHRFQFSRDWNLSHGDGEVLAAFGLFARGENGGEAIFEVTLKRFLASGPSDAESLRTAFSRLLLSSETQESLRAIAGRRGDTAASEQALRDHVQQERARDGAEVHFAFQRSELREQNEANKSVEVRFETRASVARFLQNLAGLNVGPEVRSAIVAEILPAAVVRALSPNEVLVSDAIRHSDLPLTVVSVVPQDFTADEMEIYVDAVIGSLIRNESGEHGVVVLVDGDNIRDFRRLFARILDEKLAGFRSELRSLRPRIRLTGRTDFERLGAALLSGRQVAFAATASFEGGLESQIPPHVSVVTNRLPSGEALPIDATQIRRHLGSFVAGAFSALLLNATEVDEAARFLLQGADDRFYARDAAALIGLDAFLSAMLDAERFAEFAAAAA
ncbi:MAG: hypothetical protein Q8R76_11390 [Candidatus Omnitrophota bacterium]|nr:hypothetical protein [Candidatus Omnitrophota bacterium]